MMSLNNSIQTFIIKSSDNHEKQIAISDTIIDDRRVQVDLRRHNFHQGLQTPVYISSPEYSGKEQFVFFVQFNADDDLIFIGL